MSRIVSKPRNIILEIRRATGIGTSNSTTWKGCGSSDRIGTGRLKERGWYIIDVPGLELLVTIPVALRISKIIFLGLLTILLI
jgi:hypothetical protein